jgi:tetratricopeptide (TPR) repeat protein
MIPPAGTAISKKPSRPLKKPSPSIPTTWTCETIWGSPSCADPQCPTPEVTAWNLGQAFFEEKEYNEALTWFRAAQNKNKTMAAAYVSISDVYLATAQPEAAITQLEIGMKETGGHVGLQLSLGDAYAQAGRFQDARAAFEQVIKKDPLGPAGRQATEKLKSFSK